MALRAYRVVVPPEAELPVVPLVPEPLLVPDVLPGVVVVVELPDEPMPERVPEVDDGAVEDVAGDTVVEPLSEPPAEPMPDAVPEADPVDEHAARPAAQARARRSLIMVNSDDLKDDEPGTARHPEGTSACMRWREREPWMTRQFRVGLELAPVSDNPCADRWSSCRRGDSPHGAGRWLRWTRRHARVGSSHHPGSSTLSTTWITPLDW